MILPALATTTCDAAEVRNPAAIPFIAAFPVTVKTPPVPIPTLQPEGTVNVLPEARLLAPVINEPETLVLLRVVFALSTNVVVLMRLLEPVKVRVPEPVTVNELKLPDVGIKDGIPVIEKVPLQVSVTSSPDAGAPAGDHTIEEYAILALMVAAFGPAILFFTPKKMNSKAKEKTRK